MKFKNLINLYGMDSVLAISNIFQRFYQVLSYESAGSGNKNLHTEYYLYSLL